MCSNSVAILAQAFLFLLVVMHLDPLVVMHMMARRLPTARIADTGELSRTQLRSAQRRHALSCYQVGAKQRVAHQREVQIFDHLVEGDELQIVAHSIAIHRADSLSLQQHIHFAAISNLQAKNEQFKSKKAYKEHVEVHKHANLIKHDVHFDADDIPPPSMFPKQANYCESSDKYTCKSDCRPAGVACHACGLWNAVEVPVGEKGVLERMPICTPTSVTSWNLAAADFFMPLHEDVATFLQATHTDVDNEDSAEETVLMPKQLAATDPYRHARISVEVNGQSLKGVVECIDIGVQSREKLYRIRYEDGDQEHLTQDQLLKVKDPSEHNLVQPFPQPA